MSALPKPNYEYITNEEDAKRAMAFLDNYSTIAIDTETTALDPYEAKWSLLQIGVPDKAFVFDVRYDTEHSTLHPEVMDPIFKSDKLKILQNASYDNKIIKRSRDYYLENIYDTMLTEQLSTLGLGFTKADLASLVNRYLGVSMPKEPRGTFKDYYQEFKPYQLEYAANDVLVLHTIRDLQWSKVKKDGLEQVAELEFNFVEPLCEMELNGIKVDTDKWRVIMGDVAIERRGIARSIQEILSEVENQNTLFGVSLINIDSNAQLKTALNKYGVNIESTDAQTLGNLAGLPIIDAILDYRKASKLISTYAETFLEKISKYTGRLHTDFRQMVSTGRLSSSNPNLQNIPREQKFRSCFVAKEGYSLITCDMSSAELRILGNLSKDPVFLECFRNGVDLHTRSASEIYKVPMTSVDEKMRDACKALSFGLMYGLSKFGLARRLKITENDAQNLINNYFNVFKAIKRYLEQSANDATRYGYSVSITGRRRYYNRPPADHPDRDKMINSIKRQATNMPIQGCLVAGSNVRGVGAIESVVDKKVLLDTGFGMDKAVGVYSGVKDVYDLELSNGISLGLTSSHKIPTINGEATTLNITSKKAGSLKCDDLILIPLTVREGVVTDLTGYKYVKGHWRETFVNYTCPDTMNSELAFIIGCLIGDGNYTKHNHVRYVCSAKHKELFEKFNRYVENQFKYKPVVKEGFKKKGNKKYALLTSQVSSVVIRGFLKHIGLNYSRGRNKSIPKYFCSETVENRGALLNGLFSTDGSVTKDSGPNYTTISKELATTVQQILLSLGINSNLKTYREKKRTVYRIQVFKRFNLAFNRNVGFSVEEKNAKLLITTPKRGNTFVPKAIPMMIEKVLSKSDVYKTLSKQDKAHLSLFKRGCCSYNSWRKFYDFMPECEEKTQLSLFLNYDFCKMKSFQYRGKEDVYDIMCENIHYFIANGIIVNNSNADTIKKAMIYIVDRLKNYDAKLLLCVHDEIIVESANDCLQEVSEIVSRSVVDGFNDYFSLITMETSPLIGPTWLKSACKAKVNNKKCGCNTMKFVPDSKYGTRVVCSKCSTPQEKF